MSEESGLPIKVVPPLQQDYHVPDSGGGGKKIFEEPTLAFRQNLLTQIQDLSDFFQESFDIAPRVPAVAEVLLRSDAIAKSHRPTRLFSGDTCPIIGVEGLGNLLVSVTPVGLQGLANRVRFDETIEGRANISTLCGLRPYRPKVALPETIDRPLKVKLFRHRLDGPDSLLEGAFTRMLVEIGNVEFQEVEYGGGLKIYRIASQREEVVAALARFVGTQSIGSFPEFRPVRTQARTVGHATTVHFPPPENGVEYPIVGLIDSGIEEFDPFLSPWVVGRENYVPKELQDNRHGTFVGGLLANSRSLNHRDDRFPSCSSKIVDIVALSNRSGLSEDELVEILRDAIPKHPEVKIWNLSLGGNTPVTDSTFSDLAVALDELQEIHNVTFILAGGNVSSVPLREWPQSECRGCDRIRTPADSVRSVVVGSVAHIDNPACAAPRECPSPFTRVGPGPVYLPKPDLSHYGGNCTQMGDFSQTGVVSLGEGGQLVEDIGTSFATPLVSTLAANIMDSIVGQASHNLTKALIVHSAAYHSSVSDPVQLSYRGFGTPPDISTILSCNPWDCTMIFELPVVDGRTYRKFNFPIPPSLVHNGILRCNFLMTLVYDPALDASYGSEYCRTNVEASLGTLQPNGDSGLGHKREVPEEPCLKGRAYEKDLVKYGFKWSPVKVYRRNISKMQHRHSWSLAIKMTHRAGFYDVDRQPIALVITVSDPSKSASVYNEMVREMNRLGWGALDLQITHRLRVS